VHHFSMCEKGVVTDDGDILTIAYRAAAGPCQSLNAGHSATVLLMHAQDAGLSQHRVPCVQCLQIDMHSPTRQQIAQV